jgi:cysteinyl-tRNA synthetase
MLSAHYRSPINFAPEGLEQSVGGVTRLRNCWSDLRHVRETRVGGVERGDADVTLFLKELETLDAHFYKAMDDDFNTAAAMGVLFEIVKLVNTWLKQEGLPLAFFEAAGSELRKIEDILGVIGISEDVDGKDSKGRGLNEQNSEAEEIEQLIEERGTARKAKDFARSDEIRDALLARGIVLEDTPHGTKWKRRPALS